KALTAEGGTPEPLRNAPRLRVPVAQRERPEREFTNSIGMKFRLIPAGTFMMGSPPDEAGRLYHEHSHEGDITGPFCLGIYQVTQEEYERIMGRNPSWFSAAGASSFFAAGGYKDKVKGLDTRRLPVETVSWEDAVAFCRKLSELPAEKAAGRAYRL